MRSGLLWMAVTAATIGTVWMIRGVPEDPVAILFAVAVGWAVWALTLHALDTIRRRRHARKLRQPDQT